MCSATTNTGAVCKKSSIGVDSRARLTNHRRRSDVEAFVSTQFKVEFRQVDALACVKGRTNVRVWAFECSRYREGCRKYFAAPIRTFYLKLYRLCERWPRNFYEVIPADAPCRLYFDLEYRRPFNRDVVAETLVEQFLDTVVGVVRELFQLDLDRDRSFLILDSSTAEKFSSHVVVHMPGGALFPSNLALKPLVQHICRQMVERRVGIVQADEKGKLMFICDLGVYTRNRNFRLYRSSKCGKEAVLRVSELCRFYGDGAYSNANAFLDSIVVPKDYTLYKVLEMPEVLNSAVPPAKSLPDTTASADPKVMNMCLRSLNPVPAMLSTVDELARGHGASPFPELDNFIMGVIRARSPTAELRIWCITVSKSSGGRRIQYQLNKCRYCHNIGREHKRQNVYWVVYLDCLTYSQRCFDVIDCPRYESERWSLPSELVERFRSQQFPDA